ncbi:MAG TPA: hypothetical protein VLB69_03495 [Rudaea sp.]|nr:hypothetical protein [Rudaea sp.]
MRVAIASETRSPGINGVALIAPGLDARHGVRTNGARTQRDLPAAGSNGGTGMLQARCAT